MFKEIFIYELRLWLKRPGIYIYFGIFFLLAFLLGALVSGMFGGVSTDTNSHINSSVVIADLLTSFNSDLFGLITLLICVALMAGCVQRDFQYNTFSFYFTKPVSKFNYLIGRFSASFLLTVFVLLGVMLGLWVSFALASNENGQLGPFSFLNFFEPFLFFLVLNTFFVGTLFFCLVTFTRNMTSGYVGSLVFIVVAGIARSSINNIDNKAIASLLDPFGYEALDTVTAYWTPAEKNTRLIPFSGYIAYNRLLWLGISIALLVFTYYRFSFSQFLNPVSIFKRKSKETNSQPSSLIQSIGHLPKVTQHFGLKLSMQQLVFLTRFEFLKITRSVFFLVMLGLSALMIILMSQFSGLMFGTRIQPVTYIQIELLAGGPFAFFQLIILVFYSGIVIWRERDSKVDELVGSTPVKNSVLFISKFLSLLFLCLAVNIVGIFTSVGIQAYSGYNHFELGLYFTDLFLLKIAGISLFAALSMSIQVFFKNRYFAFFAVVFIILGVPLILKVLKYNNSLFDFNSSGDLMRYSDMNGHGHTLPNYFVYKGYWIGLMIIVSTLAIALFQRGKESSLRLRYKMAMKSFNKPYKAALTLGLVFFLCCGFIAYYNRSILNTYKSPSQEEKESAEFERTYKKYEAQIQPRVVASDVNVDLFPDELGCKLKGSYYLKNKHDRPLSNIFINLPREALIKDIGFDVPSVKFLNDSVNGFFGYTLNKPLQPHDSIRLLFDLWYFPKNFIMQQKQTQIVQNGSFFNNMEMLPSIGYNPGAELSDNSARKKYKLHHKPRMAPVTDSLARQNTYISNDADWIRFECTVSTKEGQIALAPGYLVNEWKKPGRHYFQYKMDAPILNFYAFLSADYQVKKDTWINPLNKKNVVNIEIYYHKGHEYNLARMIKGIKKSLDYFTKNFSPYQHRQVRILEFPRYAMFAQSFPNTIPFSEGIGFIAKVNDTNPDEVDYPFYITSHEVAHQWWAHQVIGANTQGSTLMSETMAQYSALMVMEKEYGQAAMSKFLRYEMNKYLQARSSEGKKEVPLILCENQQYIHYNKGSMVMYALKDYLGEDTLNAALARYIRKTAFQEPPYTIAPEFYDYIKQATPDSLKKTVEDLFERIVVYDNGIKNWSYKKTGKGRYQITALIHSDKTYSDSLGKAKEMKPNDWMDLGVFTKNGKNQKALGPVIYLKKIKVTAKDQPVTLLVDQEPFALGIDPYNKLIDKNTGDNLKDVHGKDMGQGGGVVSGVVISSE